MPHSYGPPVYQPIPGNSDRQGPPAARPGGSSPAPAPLGASPRSADHEIWWNPPGPDRTVGSEHGGSRSAGDHYAYGNGQAYGRDPEPQADAGSGQETPQESINFYGQQLTLAQYEQELTFIQIRSAVASRVGFMNRMHADHVWKQRRMRPLGPDAVGFLYAVVNPRVRSERPYYEIKAATRLVFEGDADNQVALLYGLTNVANGYLEDGGIFDPVRQMTQSMEEPLPADATYVGLTVSSLDTPAGTWAEMQERAPDASRVPGRCMVLLTDGTRMIVDRPMAPHEPPRIYSNRRLSSGRGMDFQSWRPLVDSQIDPPAWEWLTHLHNATVEGQRRMEQARAADVSRRGRR